MRTGTLPAGPGKDLSLVLKTGSGFTSRMPALRLCQSRACCGVICQYSGLPASRILSSTACTCGSSGMAWLGLGVRPLDEDMSLVRRFEDMGRDAPASQRLAELEPKKRARRVARSSGVVVSLHVSHHCRVSVGHRRIDQEVVVVHD